MPDFKIYEGEDGLVRTTVHGMEQEAFVVTEDKVNNFNNYSFEFQITLTLWSVSLGYFLANITVYTGVPFIVSLITTVLLTGYLRWSWGKFEKVKKNLFIKPNELSKNEVEN